jgi:hypothetical protein
MLDEAQKDLPLMTGVAADTETEVARKMIERRAIGGLALHLLQEKTTVIEVTIGEEVIEEAIEMELEDLTVMSHQETAIVMTEMTVGTVIEDTVSVETTEALVEIGIEEMITTGMMEDLTEEIEEAMTGTLDKMTEIEVLQKHRRKGQGYN